MPSPNAHVQASPRLAPAESIATMQQQLSQLRQGQLSANHLSEWARAQTVLLQSLPPRFNQVLQDLLNRLEAGALFTEESCSFSQREIINSLQLWLDKASDRLENS